MKWLKISFRNTIRNYRRSITAVLTVAIATSAIIAGYGYMNFSFWGLTRSIVQGGTGNIHIADTRLYNDFEDSQLEFGLEKTAVDEVVQKITAQKGVRQVLKRVSFSGIISSGELSNIFSGVGVEPKAENRLRAGNPVGRYIKGKRMNDKDKYQISLGVDLARKLKVDIGDSVTILSNTTSGGINALDAVVTGIFSTGVPQRDKLELKVPLVLAQELIETDKISYMVVQLRDINTTELFIPKIKAVINDNMTMKAWWEIEPYFLAVKSVYNNIFSVMGIIILTVVLLSVSNVMNTSVMERVHEIGTLRAFGISKNRMRLNFVWEGMIIGLFGSLLGVILGFVISFTVNQIGYVMPPPPGRTSGYPLMILPTFNSIVIVVGLMMIVSAIASYIPINNVVKKKVLEQLNYV